MGMSIRSGVLRTAIASLATMLAVLGSGGAEAGPPSAYAIVLIDVPGSATTQATGINNAGVIVGMYGLSPDAILATEPMHGFVLDKGTFATLDHPDSDWTYPQDVSDTGTIVGYYGPFDQRGFALGAIHGFRHSQASFEQLDRPGYNVTFVTDANDRGQAVGFAVDGVGAANGFLADDGVFTPVQYPSAQSTYPMSINELGVIHGSAFSQPWAYLRGSFSQLAPVDGHPLNVIAANDRGDLAGTYVDGTGTHGFVLRNGTLITIDVPGASETRPLAINNRGQVVGDYLSGGTFHGFLAVPAV